MISRIGERIDAATADHVPVEVAVVLRYRAPFRYAVVPEPAQSVRELAQAELQFRSSIAASVRARVGGIDLDELHARSAEISAAVQDELTSIMSPLGCELLEVRVIDLCSRDPRFLRLFDDEREAAEAREPITAASGASALPPTSPEKAIGAGYEAEVGLSF